MTNTELRNYRQRKGQQTPQLVRMYRKARRAEYRLEAAEREIERQQALLADNEKAMRGYQILIDSWKTIYSQRQGDAGLMGALNLLLPSQRGQNVS